MTHSPPMDGAHAVADAEPTLTAVRRMFPFDVDPYAPNARELLRAGRVCLSEAVREAASAVPGILRADSQASEAFALLELEGLLDPTVFARRYLLGLIAPSITHESQQIRAERLGAWFELAGLPLSASVEFMWLALRLLHRAVAQLPWPHERRSALAAILTARMRQELKAQMEGQYRLSLDRHRLVVELEQWRMHAGSWPEFVNGAMNRLSGQLGLVALALGRPDSDARIIYEFTSSGFAPYMDAIESMGIGSLVMDARSIFGHSPQARAWRSRSIESNRSYLVDHGAAPWASAAHAAGIHSSAAFPIDDPDGRVIAILALYGRWPRQFESEPTRLFLQALRQVFAQAYAEFGRRSRVGIIPAEVRRTHLQLLSRGAVRLVYQPIIDLQRGKPIAVEALARLEDGGTSFIPPVDFLAGFGGAELNRLFVLGLRMGLRQLAQWDAQDVSLGLTLNLPPTVLVHADCVRWIQDALARTRIDPSRLMLELLEDEETSATAMRDVAIQQLATLGVRLVMDDFGSGYSNLWRLRSLPFHSVKFDRQLLSDLDGAVPQKQQFLAALMGVARSLGLRTVLEGIETPDRLRRARVLGADAGQGFVLSPPMLAEDVPEWTRSFQPDWRH